jgi:hypothetical protein
MAHSQHTRTGWKIQQKEVDDSLIAELHKFAFERPTEPVHWDLIDNINIASCYQVRFLANVKDARQTSFDEQLTACHK